MATPSSPPVSAANQEMSTTTAIPRTGRHADDTANFRPRRLRELLSLQTSTNAQTCCWNCHAAIDRDHERHVNKAQPLRAHFGPRQSFELKPGIRQPGEGGEDREERRSTARKGWKAREESQLPFPPRRLPTYQSSWRAFGHGPCDAEIPGGSRLITTVYLTRGRRQTWHTVTQR